MVLIKSNHSLTFFAFKRPLSSRERAVKPSSNPLPFSLSFSVVGSSDLCSLVVAVEVVVSLDREAAVLLS